MVGQERRIGSPRGGGCALAAIALLPLFAASAAAQAPERSGFEPSLHVGVGGLRGEAAASAVRPRWAPGQRGAAVGAHLVLAYRFGPLFAAGLHVFHQWLAVDGLADGVGATATSPGAGVLARVHPVVALWPRSPIDLSLGAGFDFIVYTRQTTTNRSAPVDSERRDTVSGFGVPLSAGLDVLLGDLALGVLAIWSPSWRLEQCHATGTGLSECQRETTDVAHYLFVGAGLRVRLEFVH